MTLKDDSVSFGEAGRRGEVKREGMTVHVVWHRNPVGRREWGSWMTFQGEELGPGMAGFDIFWGPRGLIRGDDLGRRLAAWAETPVVDNTERLARGN